MNITEALLQLNYAADNAHRRYITFGFGQMMLYNEKADEATDYIAANYPEILYEYPLIEAEVRGTNKTAMEIANNIISRRADWVAVCAKIEYIRFAVKSELDDPNADIAAVIHSAIKKLNDI